MIRSSSIREPILLSIVLVAPFTAGAEVPWCGYPPGSHVPMVANLPFTADLVVEQWIDLPDGSEGHHFKRVYSIARDNDGRVSAKGSAYTTHSGGRMAFIMEICDPIAGTKTSFDECVQDANDPTSSDGCAIEKVAKVWAAPHRNPDSGPPVFPDPFKPLPPHHSSDLVPRSGETVDLGEKSIEGIKVHGYRNVGPSNLHGNGVPLTTTKEWWLSEETALEVSATTCTSGPASFHLACSGTTTIELTNIQQIEPEPELFQVPSDYEIVRQPTIKPQYLPLRQKPGDAQTQ